MKWNALNTLRLKPTPRREGFITARVTSNSAVNLGWEFRCSQDEGGYRFG
jgi:hypothetical protein